MPDTSSDSKTMRHALNTQMLDRLAVTISVLFNPFLLPLASILLIVRMSVATTQQGLLWMVIVILFASVLPMLFILLLFRLGQLSDFRLTVREQRAKPLIFSLVSALVGSGILYILDAPREVIWLCIACVINGVVLTLITKVWKISFHSGVAAGVYDRACSTNQHSVCLSVHSVAIHCVGKSAPEKAHLPSNYRRRTDCCCQYCGSTSVGMIPVLYRQPLTHPKPFDKANRFTWFNLNGS